MSDSASFSERCSLALCPNCNHLNIIEVGAEAHMHDQYCFRCVECGAESVTSVVMRGAWPSPAFSRWTPATPHDPQQSHFEEGS